MARRAHFDDLRNPLAKVLMQTALAGPASVLAPVWAEAVGGPLARHSRPVRLAQGLLTVEVDRDFLGELERERETVRTRLNGRLGGTAITGIQLLGRQG